MTNRPSVANRTHAHHPKMSQKSLEFDWDFSVCLWQHWTPSLFGTAGPNLDPAGSGRGTRGAPTGILTPKNKMSTLCFSPQVGQIFGRYYSFLDYFLVVVKFTVGVLMRPLNKHTQMMYIEM
jgi:hypothetical protein